AHLMKRPWSQAIQIEPKTGGASGPGPLKSRDRRGERRVGWTCNRNAGFTVVARSVSVARGRGSSVQKQCCQTDEDRSAERIEVIGKDRRPRCCGAENGCRALAVA